MPGKKGKSGRKRQYPENYVKVNYTFMIDPELRDWIAQKALEKNRSPGYIVGRLLEAEKI